MFEILARIGEWFLSETRSSPCFRKVGDPVMEKGETRLWYTDDFFDLYVWINGCDRITEFQLCYDKNHHERVVTWKEAGCLSHRQVDGGKQQRNMTPILVPDGILDKSRISELFRQSGTTLDQRILELVLEKIEEYQNPPPL